MLYKLLSKKGEAKDSLNETYNSYTSYDGSYESDYPSHKISNSEFFYKNPKFDNFKESMDDSVPIFENKFDSNMKNK